MAPGDLTELPLHCNTQNRARKEKCTQRSLLLEVCFRKDLRRASLGSSREFLVCAKRVLTIVEGFPVCLVLSIIPLFVFSHCLLCEEYLGH